MSSRKDPNRELPGTRRGYDPRLVVSAMQKAIRRSDPHAACYWTAELHRSGYHRWCWKRLRVISSEDCAPGSGVVAEIEALYARYLEDPKGEPFWAIHAAIVLSTAPKSRVVDWAFMHHCSNAVERLEIPPEAIDMHTDAGRRLGRGLDHFVREAGRLEPFTGSLGALEDEYRHLVAHPPEAENPWRQPVRDSAQLTIEGEER